MIKFTYEIHRTIELISFLVIHATTDKGIYDVSFPCGNIKLESFEHNMEYLIPMFMSLFNHIEKAEKNVI